MSKRPPLGKLALAGKRSRECQLLDRERHERDRRDLFPKDIYSSVSCPFFVLVLRLTFFPNSVE
jgi:hypothetical protein